MQKTGKKIQKRALCYNYRLDRFFHFLKIEILQSLIKANLTEYSFKILDFFNLKKQNY